MTPLDLLSHMQRLDVRLWIEGDRLRYNAPEGVVTPELRAQLAEHKGEIIGLLGRIQDSAGGMAAPIPRVERNTALPLSFAQQRLWFLSQLEPGSVRHNIPSVFRVAGALDAPGVAWSLNEVVQRHEALRTTFTAFDGEPRQVVGSFDVSLPVVDLSSLPSDRREAESFEVARTEVRGPFDLERGPLLRSTLLRLSSAEHVLILAVHHIVSDGWSMGIFIRELGALYDSFLKRQPPKLPELPIQYADFSVWQRQWLTGDVLETQLSYWKQKLDKVPLVTKLPAERVASSKTTSHAGRESIRLSAKLSDELRDFSRQEKTTLFMTLLSAFKALIHRSTGQEDLVVGSPVANRTRSDVEGLIGTFVNVLVLRTDLSGNPTFRELLQRVRETTLEAYAHQDLPAEMLLTELRLERDPARPFIRLGFGLQSVPSFDGIFPGVEITQVSIGLGLAKIDLDLVLMDEPEGLVANIRYGADLFKATTIQQLLNKLLELLHTVVADPERRIATLPRLSVQTAGNTGDWQSQYEVSNLTQNQLAIWLAHKLDPDGLFNVPSILTMMGEIDAEVFQTAFTALVRSTDALRTVIVEVDGLPQQQVLPHVPDTVEMVDVSRNENPEQACEAWIQSRAQRRFELDQCLFDPALIKVNDRKFAWYMNQHHIITDGWSVSLMFNQFMPVLYDRALRNEVDAPRLGSRNFQEYVAVERERRKTSRYRKTREYWEEKLSQPIEPLTLYGRRVQIHSTKALRVSYRLDQERADKLKVVAAKGKDPTSVLDAALLNTFTVLVLTLLHRVSGNNVLSVGTHFHNRTAKFRETLGLFVQVAPLRTTVFPGETFVSLGEKVDREIRSIRRNLSYTVSPVQDDAHGVSVNFLNVVLYGRIGGSTMEADSRHTGSSNDVLELFVTDYDRTGYTLDFDFHCDVFDEALRERSIQHFLHGLDAYLEDPNQRIDAFNLLSPEETRQILVDFNRTGSPFPEDQALPQLFEAQVEKTPDRVAAVFGGEAITYGQLDARANQLARYLCQRGVGPDSLVGILMSRSADMLVSILGILKAGGAYVPLDPNYPEQRLAFMIENSGICVLLTQAAFGTDRPAVSDQPSAIDLTPSTEHRTPILILEEHRAAIAQQSTNKLPAQAGPRNLSYVIYTSGSTGVPKGAMIEHRGMINHLYAKITELGLSEADVVAQTASQCFDISVWQFLVALLVGGRVDIFEDELAFNALRLPDTLAEHEITIFETVPSLLGAMLPHASDARLNAIRMLLVTGEAVPPELCRQWLTAYPNIPMLNAYGPTECSDDVTHYLVDAPPAQDLIHVPIGHPLANTQVYITSRNSQPQPLEVPGELCVGGVGVGRGYYGDGGRTAEVFVPDPFSTGYGARLYRTGDLTRYLADGHVEFLGRLDHQVKVRGFRIELGEIETALRKHTTIKEAVVVTHSGSTANRIRETRGEPISAPEPRTPDPEHLVAYVVGKNNTAPDIAHLRQHLGQTLPDYMVPGVFMVLDALPLNPSGKIDRNALPTPDPAQQPPAGVFVPPRTGTEKTLAAIWCEALGLHRVGVHDNFFEAGGHSLLATQIASRIHKTFGVEIPLRHLFDSPTIAQLAVLIDGQPQPDQQLETLPIGPAPRDARLPLSFAQQRLWFIDQLVPGSPMYNMPAAVRLRGKLDPGLLAMSLNEVVRRHESVRTTFVSRDGEPSQVIAPMLTLSIPMVDLQELPESTQEPEARGIAYLEAQKPFDLTNGPLLRATLMRLGDNYHIGLFTMHHIVSDGWSMGVLIREMGLSYEAFSEGKPAALPELPLQYADFAHWQRDWLQGEALEKQLSYWKDQLKDAPPALELPRDRPRQPLQTFPGKWLSLPLSAELSETLKHFGRTRDCTLFMILLTALNIVLFRYTREEDIVIGSTIAGRNRAELEGLIGFFINALPLRTKLNGDPTFEELLARVRETCLGAYTHQDLPFDKVVEELQPDRDMSHNPFFQICFNMVNVPNQRAELAGLSLERLSQEEPGAKFDLTLYAPERANGIELAMVFNTQLFDAPRITIMLEQLASILSQAVEQPNQHIGAYSLITPSTTGILPDRAAPLDDRWEGAIQELFSREAERRPERHAVIDGRDVVTYGELNRRSNELAHYLLSRGINTGDVVAIYGHRSASLVWALMGVLKAGAAFTILDPAYPAARLLAYLTLAQPKGWLRIDAAGELPRELQKFTATLPCSLGLPQFSAGGDLWREFSKDDPIVASGPDALAYVAFTSGSTGEPKGILGRHGPITHFLPWQRDAFGLNANDRFILLSGLSYNHLQRDIFTPLAMGGTVYIPDETDVQSPERILEWIKHHEITVLTLTPARGRLIVDASQGRQLPSLRSILFGGDTITWHEVSRIQALAPCAHVVAVYGATETQRAVSHFVVPKETDGSELQPIPLGRGIKDVQVLVLGDSDEMCGVGELGELCFRSPHLAQGYLQDEALTRERFVVNTLTRKRNDRLYRTGEMARYRPDGNVQFVSRGENRVNIRGFRVELGEVETALRQHEDVREVTVVAREFGISSSSPQDQRLVAYIVRNDAAPASNQRLRAFLRRTLPDYMVPAAFLTIDELPLTPNGKTDHNALPAPEREDLISAEVYVLPRTPLEETLRKIWQDVLGVDKIGVHDNFFDLGGHSFVATQMISRIRQQVDSRITLRELFSTPTISGIAEAIEGMGAADESGSLSQPIDFAEEAILDPEIRPPGTATQASLGEPREILLTGATGFLGAYLLRDLLEQTAATIHCLVRAESPEQGRERLQKGLEQCHLWKDTFPRRMVPVVGDLSQSLMGLEENDFARLAQDIDVVYHNGAWVNHVYPYTALKPINVLGTREVLRFACTGQIKPVHFISSIAVLRSPGPSKTSGTLKESDFPEAQSVMDSGYIQTKWVAEGLVRSAGERGLPVSVYRPALVTGDSLSGYSNTSDFFYQAIKGCIDSGTSPLLDGIDLNLVPVDYVSRAVIDLSRNPGSIGKTFHLANNEVVSWNAIVSWLEAMGYAIKQVPLDQWRNAPKDRLPPIMLGLLSQFPPTASAGNGHRQPQRIDVWNTLEALTGTNLQCPLFEPQLLETYISFLTSSGFLPSPQKNS